MRGGSTCCVLVVAAFRRSWGSARGPETGRRAAVSVVKQRISAVAQGRHKRDTDARSSKLRHFAKPSLKISRAAVVAAPVALVATAAAVTLGVAGNGPVSSAPVAAADLSRVAPTASAPATLSPAEDHSIPVSRSLNRKKQAAAKAARAARTAKAAKDA